MYIAHLKACFHIFHFLVDISNMLRINATSKRVSQASIWRRWSFGTTFCLISCLKNFLWKTSTFSSKIQKRKSTGKKATMRYLSEESSNEKSVRVEQYTSLKVFLNQKLAHIKAFMCEKIGFAFDTWLSTIWIFSPSASYILMIMLCNEISSLQCFLNLLICGSL